MKTLFKYLMLTILVLLVVVGTFFIGADFGRFTEEQKTERLNTPQVQEKYPNYTTYLTQEYYDRQGRNFVYGSKIKIDGKWYLIVVLTGWDERQELVKREIDFDEKGKGSNYYSTNFIGAWDNNDKYLAVSWGDLGWIWDITDKKKAILIGSFSKDKYGFRNLFFVGNEGDLYASDETGLYRLGETSVLIEKQGYEFEPLVGGDGYSYWLDALTGYAYPNRLVINKNSKVRIYNLNFQADAADSQIFSPDEKKVCFNTGTSGYYGFSIYELTTRRRYQSGPQYSYCLKWLDNYRVMLKEVNYYFQWTAQYYIYDTRTDKMEFVFAGDPNLNYYNPPKEWP